MRASTSNKSPVKTGVPAENHFANYFSLFGSLSTLVCCALPSLFVALGMGATFASLINTLPGLVWLSLYKTPIFLGTGVLLGATGILHWRARNLPCPADPLLARSCTQARRISLAIYTISVALFAIGVVFSYLLPVLMLAV